MSRRRTPGRSLLSALVSAAVVSATATVLTPPAVAEVAATTASQAAAQRLRADGDGDVALTRDPTGRVTFVGTASGAEIDNPAVSRATSVGAAARAHLDRYGAALGAGRRGTSLVQRQVTRTVAGTDAVTYTQRVGGLPVIGGDVVVTVGPDRELVSVLSTLSDLPGATVPLAPVVPESRAARTALVVARRHGATGDLRVDDLGRWVLDPAVVGGAGPAGARTVHRLEVTNGADVRRLVLVDDQTGQVAMTFDDVQHVDRVVCDGANRPVASEQPCTSGFARTETSAASTVADVEDAFTLSGRTSDFYAQVGGLDLTQLLGIDVGGTRKLASTVRLCVVGERCPYENAFWNGSQMYYGAGFAGADDVVGHEMTHGVVDRYSQLFYWGQSGAMNESFADVMGEIIDHRHGTDDDAAWGLGEDLPTGAIRSMSDPTRFGDPDSTTSARWSADPEYDDNGGVHANSGVGNKAAYLLSQGGQLNGVTVTGIDAGDPTLAKTARLYLYAIQSLTSGSDYADLARVLAQGCQSMLGTGGFTAATCAQVAAAASATRLTTTPTAAPQPADAPTTCPTGTKRVLFDSETGTPATKLSAGPGWERGSSDDWGSNATSGLDSWYDASEFSSAAMVPTQQTLALAAPLTVPSRQPTYLSFEGWYVLDHAGPSSSAPAEYYDGATVEVTDQAAPITVVDTAALPWVNGPDRTIARGFLSPVAGRRAFAGDSHGWTRSRLDLSSFAGRTITPRFTLSYDDSTTFPGWWLDDITVWTCDPTVTDTVPPPVVDTPAVAPTPSSPPTVLAGVPSIGGRAMVGRTLTARAGTWTPADVVLTYQWLRGGTPIAGATGATYRTTRKDAGKRVSVRVTGTRAGSTAASATSAATKIATNRKVGKGRPGTRGTRKPGRAP